MLDILYGKSGVFALDIETFPDLSLDKEKLERFIGSKVDKRLKDEEKIKEKKKELEAKLALNAFTSKIFIVGLKKPGEEAVILLNKEILTEKEFEVIDFEQNPNIFVYNNEKELLTELITSLNEALDNGNIVITYNGKEFDFPFILKRAVISGVEYGIYYYNELIKKYSNSMHIDLFSMLDGSLNLNAEFLLNYKPEEINFEKVITDRNFDIIIKKNREDLNLILGIFDKLVNWIRIK